MSYYYRTYDGETAVEAGQKHTWLVRHDGLLFASGWYENVVPAAQQSGRSGGANTQWFVQDAVDVYDVGGLEALLKRYNDPRAWMATGTSTCSTWRARSSRTRPCRELLGQSVLGPVGVDITGRALRPGSPAGHRGR